jgi:hypothetical protein
MKSSEGSASMEIVVLKHMAMAISIVMVSSNPAFVPELEDANNPGGWIVEEVAGLGVPKPYWTQHVADRTSIALDSKELPHIAYRNVETGEINYSNKDSSGNWHTETVVGADVGGGVAALALDSKDNPVICYRNLTHVSDWLSCAFSEISDWRYETVDPTHMAGIQLSLTMDDQDRPHLAYSIVGGDTKYAWWNGKTWNITVIRVVAKGLTGSVSLDLDNNNTPYVALSAISGPERGLWMYRQEGMTWVKEFVDYMHSPGVLYGMFLDESDLPHLVVLDYARRLPLYWFNDGDGWRFRYVDTDVMATYGSFHLDAHGIPHVAYYDSGESDLRYAHLENGSWKVEVVDSDGLVGFLPSIIADSDDVPHISYIDLTDRLIRYATKKKQINARIDIDPDTLNQRSMGKWVTCYIELPAEHDPREINASTVLLMDSLSPELDPKYGFVKSEGSYIVDHDGNGVFERMVKFSRQEVILLLDSEGDVVLLVTGQLQDGTEFSGEDTIRIVSNIPQNIVMPITSLEGKKALPFT